MVNLQLRSLRMLVAQAQLARGCSVVEWNDARMLALYARQLCATARQPAPHDIAQWQPVPAFWKQP